MSTPESTILYLTQITKDFGLSLSHEQCDFFEIYLEELWIWNQHKNLSGLNSKKRMIIELFLDSLIPIPFIPENVKLLDLGSGAGFPGLPMKIYNPRLIIHLLEINQKKVSFLKHIIRLLKLTEIKVLKARIENEVQKLAIESYDIITARAVADPNRIITLCRPLLHSGSRLICFWGQQAFQYLENDLNILRINKLQIEKKITYNLPGKTPLRHVIIFKKISS